jgi:hypothetical protein
MVQRCTRRISICGERGRVHCHSIVVLRGKMEEDWNQKLKAALVVVVVFAALIYWLFIVL